MVEIYSINFAAFGFIDELCGIKPVERMPIDRMMHKYPLVISIDYCIIFGHINILDTIVTKSLHFYL